MEVIAPEFKDAQEQNKVTLLAILTFFTGFIAPLIVFLAIRETLSPAADTVNNALLNFEILMAILTAISMIPIVGWLAAVLLVPFVAIAHIIVTIAVALQAMNGSTIKIWAPIKFIK